MKPPRKHIRANPTPPPARSVEERLDALERAILGLTRSMGNLKTLKDSGQGLPTLPAGSGHALSVARQKARWSNRQLAEAVGVSPSMLSLWECEKHAIPHWRADAILTVFTNAEAEPPIWNLEAAEGTSK